MKAVESVKNAPMNGKDDWRNLFRIFPRENPKQRWQARIFWTLFGFAAWQLFVQPPLPKPLDCIQAIHWLWYDYVIWQDLLRSIWLNLCTVVVSAALSLVLAYLTPMPFFRPPVTFFSLLRYVSIAGITIVFILMSFGPFTLKLTTLVYSVSVFYTASMMRIVAKVPQEDIDYIRTLRASPWQIVWQMVILARLDDALQALADSAAIGFMMLASVEILAKSGGGIGVVISNLDRYKRFAPIFAMLFIVWLIGLGFEKLFLLLRKKFCKHAMIATERR